MVGTRLYKPLQDNVLRRTEMREVTRNVEKQVEVQGEDGFPVGFKTVTEAVTEPVPHEVEEPNPAPNTRAKYAEAAAWCRANRATIEDKGEWYEVVALPEPSEEEKLAALQKRYTALVQGILDAEARKLGYDSCLSACSYVDTGVEKFDGEGRAFREWRSEVWARGFEILDEVLAGERGLPAEEELVGMLPGSPYSQQLA